MGTPSSSKRQGKVFALAQRLGRSLMLPIASLPAAALLLRLGQPDMLGADGLGAHLTWLNPVADVMAAAGNALISNLAYLFALGVAIGFARKSDGSTALAALIGYFVFTAVTDTLAPYFGQETPGTCADAVATAGLDAANFACAAPTYSINYGVLGGIAVGILAAILYQKFYRIRLPQYLAFFGGRRFVPIITAACSIVLAVIFSLAYPIFDYLFNKLLGGFIMEHGSNPATGFVFGTVNRLLIPFGLHHLLNSLPWFQLGQCTNAAGETIHGDITCFLSGVDGTNAWTGNFMTGFFPIMMFALLGAALAFYRTALPQNRKVVGGVMISLGLTSFITGVTEPLEFAFAYVAAPLYVVHALLTGSSLALVNYLGIKSGFGFSAGAIDYLLNLTKAAGLSGGFGKVLLIIPIGLVYAAIYYFLFSWAIRRFNLPTPGRDAGGSASDAIAEETSAPAKEGTTTATPEASSTTS
ncbi:PTS transporter subunit EIIC [Nanchangia anserum]|uniref:PTS transporter subunit EIIC n=1 Tax=Nanchangia anserum TaxID=2692125 RepID=A0A8I0GCX4_9ACTO|nr:PTS transporter subunit EIIC [Nanchangia anserum]MBD3689696.1 PTS transporter subunit EIIC [Nanchangia anserum]QOX81871.1 PTS transporter subunit EIIC [Nanchangia anserum]